MWFNSDSIEFDASSLYSLWYHICWQLADMYISSHRRLIYIEPKCKSANI